VVSVPSGNFGDLTAGLLAKSLGLPVKRFIAATNANDTVPVGRFSGQARHLHGQLN
jgi:threonine synthase